MQYGFRIVFHKSIPFNEELKKFLDKEKEYFCSENSYKCRRDSAAFFRRGLFGYGLTEKFTSNSKDGEIIYTFKRLSKSRRIFGVIPVRELVHKNPPLELNQCMCAIHRGGQRVNLKTPYKEEDYITYFEVGEIKS